MANLNRNLISDIKLLLECGYTQYRVAKMLGVEYEYVRKTVSKLRKREERKNNKQYDFDRCPDCGKWHIYRDVETGELVCTFCGLVLGYINDGEPVDGEKYYRQPQNSMMFGKGLGNYNPGRQLNNLKKAGLIKRLSPKHVISILEGSNLTKLALEKLSFMCQQGQGFSRMSNEELCRLVRKEIKNSEPFLAELIAKRVWDKRVNKY